jgi:hypothetical protein
VKEQKNEVKIIREFAKQRRIYGKDTYDLYTPPEKPRHREKITLDEYNLVIGSVLLQSASVQESRKRFLVSIKSFPTVKGVILYLLTFLPRWLLKVFFLIRSNILNNV